MKLKKEQTVFGAAWLLLFTFVFATLDGMQIASGDESRVAGIAAEMSLTGDYLVPRLNGAPFLEYPPFYYWCTALSYRIFGITDFAAKVPTALAACVLLALSYAFARKLDLSQKESMLAPFFLLFSGQFFAEIYRCRVDMMLSLMVALAIYAFYTAEKERRGVKKILRYVLFTLALTGGMYTKGLLGAVLPAAVIGVWLILSNCQQKRFSWRSYLNAFGCGVIALALVGLWYYLLKKHLGDACFHNAVWVNNFGRFSGSQGDHAGEWAYYLQKLPTLFLPWLPLLFFALWNAIQKKRRQNETLLLMLCALLVPFVLLNLSSAKRVVYLLPLALPAAVLCAWQIAILPPKIKTFLPHPRIAAAFFFIIIFSGFEIVAVLQAIKINREESLRALFTRCRELEQQGYEITVAPVPERTLGAYYFYLHHAGRRVALDAPLKTKECRIFRSRTLQTEFNDYHGIAVRHQ